MQKQKRLSVESSFVPDAKDIKFYELNGWFISPAIIPEELLDRAYEGIQRYYRGERDYELPDLARHFDWTEEMGNSFRLNNYLALQMKELRELAFYEPICSIAGVLTRTSEIRLYKDSIFYKPPSTKGIQTLVGWHTDKSYWRTCTSEKMITAWIPFQDCDINNGTMAVMDGSHKWNVSKEMRNFYVQDLDSLENEIIEVHGQIKKTILTLKRGQVSFHHCKLIHGSLQNDSKEPRISFAMHLQDKDNSYQKIFQPNGKVLMHLNDLLCRKLEDGNPDLSDSNFFPLLWPQNLER